MSLSDFSAIPREHWIAENSLAFAIRDGFPVSPGHSLVITKRVVPTWFDATDAERRAVMDLVDAVRMSLDAELHPQGYNVGFNAGVAAGQTVMHLHVHVIPRYDGDMDDPRGGVRHAIPARGNYLRASTRPLATGGRDDPFLDHLAPLFARAQDVAILAAFVQNSGVDLLRPLLSDGNGPTARVRILTGDYLHITQASALESLLDWAVTARDDARGVEVRVFETERQSPAISFHAKSWRVESGGFAVAFVGSSNLSRSALRQGIEWNLRVDRDRDPVAYRAIVDAFEHRWAQATPLDARWIEDYRRRALAHAFALPPGEVVEDAPPLPEPHAVQRAALAAIASGRASGARSGLVVLATGLGKTLVAALDAARFSEESGRPARVIVLAHREELLAQAARQFRAAARAAGREPRVAWYAGASSELSGDLVLASVQKLARPAGLAALSRERFDYAVVDEVHHADADSYRRVLGVLHARFVLGLTATPERPDGGDVLGLFGDTIFHRTDLGEGIARGLLVPFRYFGLKDTVSYDAIPWRRGRFDVAALDAALASLSRMEKLWEALVAHPGARTLVFAVSRAHARYVRDDLVRRGLRVETVLSDGGTLDRAVALAALATGAVDALVTVDLFNEGVDLPGIDRVVMLRPTESNVVFLQQLGRGLRRAEGKRELTVIDFVGNHRAFLWKVEALLSLAGPSRDSLVEALAARKPAAMPPGCSMELELEAIELLRTLLPTGRKGFDAWFDRFVEAHGRRPTAGEALRSEQSLTAIRTAQQGWFDAVRDRGCLSEEESRALSRHGAFLRELETTPITRSFKIVVLSVLVDAGAFFEGMDLDTLASRSLSWLRRDHALRGDIEAVKELGDADTMDPGVWRGYWKKNPIAAWTRGSWFALRDDRFVTRMTVAPEDRDILLALVSELVDLRLAQYRRRGERAQIDGVQHVCRVTWNQRDPILALPGSLADRGEIEARLPDGGVWIFRCAKAFCNVARPAGASRNALPDLLRGWFGPTAGHPGTTFAVRFRQGPDGLAVAPEGASADTAPTGRIPFYPTLAAAAGAPPPSTHESPPEGFVALPVVAQQGIFAVRASGDSMDGGRAPIREGDWCVLRWMRGASVEALRDRVVLVQTTARDDGMRFQLKRLVERDRGWCFVSDGEGPSFAATAETVVLARVERVVTPESLAPVVGSELDEAALAAHFGWDAFTHPTRRDGHRFAWVERAEALLAPDRVAPDGPRRWPGETSYVFTRAKTGAPWRYGGVARWREDEGAWAFDGVDRSTWQSLAGGRGASRTLPLEVLPRVDAWIAQLAESPGFGATIEVEGRTLRIVRRSDHGGLRIDGGDGGFKERTVSRADLGWTLLAADDVARLGGVLDEPRVNRLRYLDGTPKESTRWIDTGWAIRLWRLSRPRN
ncbi:MAG: DEAD/DEAH box helicase family protein [Polyangiales bacterium]